jgi:hypothetical protein
MGKPVFYSAKVGLIGIKQKGNVNLIPEIKNTQS